MILCNLLIQRLPLFVLGLQHQWLQFYYVLDKKVKDRGLTHSRVMIHQPLGGAQDKASDIEITAREIEN